MVEPVDEDVEGAHPRDLAALQDPEFVETYNPMYELGLGEGRHVSAKVREFVAIALLCFRGSERAGLVAHMERAIRFGATREELFEVLETCIIPGGAPTFHRGLGALMEVKGGLMDPARFAQGMTFAQYLDFVGTPENLAREARVASALLVTVRSRTP